MRLIICLFLSHVTGYMFRLRLISISTFVHVYYPNFLRFVSFYYYIFFPVLLFLLYLTRIFFFFFFNNTAPTEIYPLPLHAAFPISESSCSNSTPPRHSSTWSKARPTSSTGRIWAWPRTWAPPCSSICTATECSTRSSSIESSS